MISHRRRVASTAVLLSVAAAGCTTSARPDDIVVMASGADLESANPLVTTHPLSRQVQRFALFVTLLRYDSTLAPQPYYARRWAWSDGGRTLTLSLLHGLRWHDGTPTTASDAAFTLLAARDPATGFPRASELAALDTALARDDTTLVLRFRAPPPALPSLLVELPIVPRHLLDIGPRSRMRSLPFNDVPVGNGPFRFTGRRPGTRWTFARNDAFPPELGGPPALRGLVIAVVDEATTKFAGLASGELDVAGISPSMAALASQDLTLRVISYPVLFGTALFFNTTRPPFDDVRVRRAIARSIDRARIVDVALAGFGRPSSSPVPPESPLAWTPPDQRNAAEADSLLDAAGWFRGARGVRAKGTRPLDVELLSVGSGDNVVEQLLQADLMARGLVVRVRQTEMGNFLTTARAADKRFDLLLAGVPGNLSLSYLSAMFATNQRGGTFDYTGYHAPSLDTLLGAAANAPAGDAAKAAWSRVQQALDTLAPATWLYHSRGLQGITRRLRGVTMDLRGELVTVHDWTLAPHTTSPR